MVTDGQRDFIWGMVRARLFVLKTDMRLTDVHPVFGVGFILKFIKKRQKVDDLHHAPCCPANHFHGTRLVFGSCTCGALKLSQKKRKTPHLSSQKTGRG